MLKFALLISVLCFSQLSIGQPAPAKKPRARDLGIPFDGKPGIHNAITDVKGVLVGENSYWEWTCAYRGNGDLSKK